jgi:hypothetical protein
MSTKKVRRSVVISSELAEALVTVPRTSARTNFNRIVTVALEEYLQRQQQKSFMEAMRHMAEDEEIQRECQAIAQEFGSAETDGLDD